MSPATTTTPRTALSRSAVLLLLSTVLVALLAAGLFIGSGGFTAPEVWHALFNDGEPTTTEIIREQRIPRTLLAALVGAALGLAGAVMQGLTRNPLADPGILGVNSGAYFAMVLGSVLTGAAGTEHVRWALGGAFAASIAVYFVGSRGIGGAGPAKLVLTGVAIASMLSGLAFGLTMIHPRTFDAIRGLLIGTLDGRGWPQLSATWLLVSVGAVGAIALTGYLNALALGDDRAGALGVPVTAVRAGGFVVVTVLCGAATAAVGPLSFVGLMVPHAVRMAVGPDHRWMIPLCLVAGPIVLVGSDLVARIATASELPVGMVTAFLGAPVLIWLARHEKGTQW